MVSLWRADGTFDLIGLNAALLQSGKMEEVGGAGTVGELVDDVPTPSMLPLYLRTLEDFWRRREIWLMGERLQTEAMDGDVGRGLVTVANQLEALRGRVFATEGGNEALEAAVAYLAKVPEWEPVWATEGEEAAEALRGVGLHGVALFGLEMGPELFEVLGKRWVVVVSEMDDARARGFVRQVLDHCRRLHLLEMGKVYAPPESEPATVAGYLAGLSQKRGEVDGEAVRRELRGMAEETTVPKEIAFDRLYTVGDRGGITILQDRMANRLVKLHDLMHSGDFWQWDRGGRYVDVRSPEKVEAWVREALRSDGLTEPMISKSLIESVVWLMRSAEYCHPDRLNAVEIPHLVNCRSGMLNVLTGELLPHDRRFRSTTQLPVEWDERAECPRFLEWLQEMKPEEDERNQVQEMYGYCAIPGISYHVFFFLFGPGGTGKSTVVDILSALVGQENTLALQLEELDNPFTRGSLVGKRLYLAGELTKNSWKHIGLIKQIAANEPVYVDRKHKPGFSFLPQGRFVMTSNVVAHTPDAGDGFGRRFLQMNWMKSIPREQQDFRLKEKLLKELPGIFRWAVEGYRRLHARGHFAHTRGNIEAINELMRHRNQVKSFLEAGDMWVKLDAAESSWCTNQDLLDRFVEWCEHYGVKPFTTDQMPFVREVCRVRPELQERRRRSIPPGQKEKVRWLAGVEVGRSTPDEE